MRYAIFIKGDNDMRVVPAPTLEFIEVPEGYRVREWMGHIGSPSTEEDWRQADHAIFIHRNIRQQGVDAVQEAVRRGWERIKSQDPDYP